MCKPAILGGLARFRLTGFLKRGAVMTHYSDEHLIELFHCLKDCTLPRVEWTHAAHLGAAVCLLAECTLEDAERTMPVLIRAYNEATGTPNSDTHGYHHTITLASLRAVEHVRSIVPGESASDVLRVLLASSYGNAGWLFIHWSRPVLFSSSARRAWVEPDLLRLPF